MTQHEFSTYRITEVVGTSSESVQSAVRNGVARAGETIRHLEWFEVSDIRGTIKENAVELFQVTMKLGFKVED